ncbi:MAG: SH3 domain-containing protein, partial [Oscillospiraceae bacterium]|nr:SH3 domain-containing protein [Oscillospiraceae bacterium]MDR2505553.1 SH3 domain-containing protein [Oscillospiraceae bacterium]
GGTDGAVVGKVNNGEEYMYYGQAASGWYQIKLSDGTLGYVSNRFVKLVN